MYRIKSRHKRYRDIWADGLWQKKMVSKFASQREIQLKDFTWSTNDGPNDLFTKFIQDLQLFFLRRALGVAIYQLETRENRYEFKKSIHSISNYNQLSMSHTSLGPVLKVKLHETIRNDDF